MSRTKKSPPQSPEDIATSVAVRIAKLLVSPTLTPATYQQQRDYVNSLPGVDIRQLPRDAEFGYQN